MYNFFNTRIDNGLFQIRDLVTWYAETRKQDYKWSLQLKNHARKWATFFDEDVTGNIHGENLNDINNFNTGNIRHQNETFSRCCFLEVSYNVNNGMNSKNCL